MEQTKGSLRNFFYDEEDILERDRFLQLHGTGEAQILAADGTVNNVRLCKEDATDEAGRQIWVMSVQVNWDHVNLALLNEAIYSGFWYFDCDENSEIVNANWSHEFRKMLGYHDTLDFPNKLESWSDPVSYTHLAPKRKNRADEKAEKMSPFSPWQWQM